MQTRGNVLKIDRHKYVKVAYHGFQQFTSSERQAVYETSAVRDSYDEPAYAMIDTLFSLAEAHLFMRLVELMVCSDVYVSIWGLSGTSRSTQLADWPSWQISPAGRSAQLAELCCSDSKWAAVHSPPTSHAPQQAASTLHTSACHGFGCIWAGAVCLSCTCQLLWSALKQAVLYISVGIPWLLVDWMLAEHEIGPS